MATITAPPSNQTDQDLERMTAGVDPLLRVAAWVSLAHGLLWGLLFFRWVTFGSIGWTPFDFENALATFPGIVPYLLFGIGLVVDLAVGVLLLRQNDFGRWLGIGRSAVMILLVSGYWWATGEFYGAATVIGIAGFLLTLLTKQTAWAINYPAAFWLIVFFVVPNLIVFIISLGERGARGTIDYPQVAWLFSREGWSFLVDDYVRFFSTIGGQRIYLRIFWRSIWMASANTMLCLAFGYPFAYWIARQDKKWREILIFLVMIPFWTNFLVRTYAWMLLLRDSGLINNIWTSTLHNQAVALSGSSALFARIAEWTSEPMTLLFTPGAVLVGLFYGFFPFVVLPIYSNLEQLDWSLLEAASDLGASGFQSTVRVLLPLSMPGIVAGAIIVFVPSLGAYVTPDLMGGGKVSMLGNVLQQQFMTARDWPFGSAIGFIMMAIMLLAIVIYFRVGGERNE